MKKKSLRQQARELQISPAYLSMILSGQRNPNALLKDKLCSLGMFTNKANLSLRGRCPRPLDECAKHGNSTKNPEVFTTAVPGKSTLSRPQGASPSPDPNGIPSFSVFTCPSLTYLDFGN